jgi:hypothetical protein
LREKGTNIFEREFECVSQRERSQFYVGAGEEDSLAMRVKTVNLMKEDRRWGVSNKNKNETQKTSLPSLETASGASMVRGVLPKKEETDFGTRGWRKIKK